MNDSQSDLDSRSRYGEESIDSPSEFTVAKRANSTVYRCSCPVFTGHSWLHSCTLHAHKLGGTTDPSWSISRMISNHKEKKRREGKGQGKRTDPPHSPSEVQLRVFQCIRTERCNLSQLLYRKPRVLIRLVSSPACGVLESLLHKRCR